MYPEFLIGSNFYSRVDDRELINKTKLIEEDIKAKFERYTELIKDIPELKQLEENMQPCELQIQDDLDKISSDLAIEFGTNSA